MRAANPNEQPTARLAAFAPPWRGQQDSDAVTGATPKRASLNRSIQALSPSVVGISTFRGPQHGASGIIVHRLGYILTNHHAVRGAKNILVTLVSDQLIKSYAAELVDSEPALDLAIIKATSSGKKAFQPAPLGDSGRIFIGQNVVAIGNPLGLAQAASAGTISNTRRFLTAGNKVFEDLIQTDASISPGSSGGALVNTEAEVIGVNTVISSPVHGSAPIGFAVPINQAKDVFRDFIEIVPSPLAKGNAAEAEGDINRANRPGTRADLRMMSAPRSRARCWLGIDVRPLGGPMASQLKVPVHRGLFVNRVFGDSPGARAGLLRGDVIYRVNDRRVRDANMFWSYLSGGKVGDQVRITLFRENTKMTFLLRLAPQPPNVRFPPSKPP